MKINASRKKDTQKRILAAMVAIVSLTLGFVATITWLQFQSSKATEEISDMSNISRTKNDNKESLEGRNETPVTKNILDSYSVAADKPRAIYIDKLGVAARTLPMSVNKDGSMQAPLNIYDAGWYTGSSLPSQDGVLAIDGHASGPTKYGLFGRLDELVNGDRVQIETGDGTMYQYEVVHKENLGREDVDMGKFVSPYGENPRGLNLMTCAGNWEQDAQTFANRIVVYTKLVEA